jgi:uncharacterized protein (DUF58 family)
MVKFLNIFKSLWKKRSVILPTTILLSYSKIYILPTKNGLLFALILLIMLLGAMNYNNSMGYLLTFFLGSMAMVATLHTHRNLLGLRLQTGRVSPVFAGDAAQFTLWLDNRGHAARHAITWQYIPQATDSKWLIPNTWKFEQVVDIPANQQVTLTVPVPTSRRGHLALEQLVVYTRFPLGLFHAWSYVHLDMATLVYPTPNGTSMMPNGQPTAGTMVGNPRDGGGEDFMGYRDYRPGDSPRHIDWKAVARGQDWLIKQFGGTSAMEMWFTWEDVKGFNHLEAALSQLCLWIVMADSQGMRYGLQLPECTVALGSGDLHRERCLRALALF